MKGLFICLIPFILTLSACKPDKINSMEHLTLSSFRCLVHPNLVIDRSRIHERIRAHCLQNTDTAFQPQQLLFNYYQENDSFLWLNSLDNQIRIDTLLSCLTNSYLHGLNPELFFASKLRQDWDRFRSLDLSLKENVNELMADLEFNSSLSYIKYVCGMNFGFIDPRQILNNYEEEQAGIVAAQSFSKEKVKKKMLYEIELKVCDTAFVAQALEAVQSDLATFLHQIQPVGQFYRMMQHEWNKMITLNDDSLKKIPEIGDTILKKGELHQVFPLIANRLMLTGELNSEAASPDQFQRLSPELLDAVNRFRRKNCIPSDEVIGTFTIKVLNRELSYYKERLKLNMERMRWKTRLEKGDKYVQVNVAAFVLQAMDVPADSLLEMRVCCGTYANRTPLIASTITYIELNPYWNVPQSIIKKEMIPAFKKDPNYFVRNKMKVYDRFGSEIDPRDVNWSRYKSNVPYEVKQESGVGNSLGRLIFRFPNAHSVYLHDTPSHWSFMKSNRAVSHGCVRLENPLDFAFFLLKEKDEVTMDRIRVAIDLKPATEKGRKATQFGGKTLKHLSLEERIPLFLDYYTVYLSKTGDLYYCEDTYKYDEPLLKELNKMNEN